MFFFGTGVIIIEIYIRNWIQNFYDPNNGPLFSKDDVNYFYQYQGMVGTSVTFVLMFPTAKVIDKLSPKVMIPIAFIQRALVNFVYFRISSPKSLYFYIVAPLQHYTFFFMQVQLVTYIQKKFPKNVRSILTTLYVMCIQLGSLSFTLIAQQLFNIYGFRIPFLAITLSDVAIASICVILAVFGLITNKKLDQEKM